MEALFRRVAELDEAARVKLGISSEILMENAARSLSEIIRARFPTSSVVQIIAGSGDNGADGIALARMLMGDYRVRLIMPFGVRSELGKLQLARARACEIEEGEELLEKSDVLIDALFGSGLSRPLDCAALEILHAMNAAKSYKIACDIPSGINPKGNADPEAFRADLTCVMGAIPEAIFNDGAKEFIGELIVGNLGIARALYEKLAPPSAYLLEAHDICLPHRLHADTHKGSYGHVAVVAGEQGGASVLSALSALNFGAGLVSLVGEVENAPHELMKKRAIPENTSAIACGMGLGAREIPGEIYKIPSVIDADMFHRSELIRLLKQNQNLILTPHAREFSSLLEQTNLAKVSASEVQKDRFALVRKFAKAYPHATLVLKGANPLIAQNEKLYVNPLGNQALAKGGSGDVLSGIIAALLAQGYAPIEAAIHGSLAHTLAARKVNKADYALTPLDLVNALGNL